MRDAIVTLPDARGIRRVLWSEGTRHYMLYVTGHALAHRVCAAVRAGDLHRAETIRRESRRLPYDDTTAWLPGRVSTRGAERCHAAY